MGLIETLLSRHKTATKKPKITENMANSMGIHTPEPQFIAANVRRELLSVLEDALQPYVFEDKNLYDVYPLEDRLIRQKSLNIKDILLHAMLGETAIINRVRVGNDLVQKELLFSGEPENGQLDLEGTAHSILASMLVEPIYTKEEIGVLKMCFSALWYAYQRQNRSDTLDAKFIFKMHGFHALFTQPKTQEEQMVAQANRAHLIDNMNEILEGRAGIIDAQDDFGVVGGAENANHHTFVVDHIYMEIARILKVPATRLLGRAPSGLNATGESDALNYDMTLDRIRTRWLEPLLQHMGFAYQKIDKIDIDYLQKIAQMYSSLGMTPPASFVERIMALGDGL